MEGRDLFPLPEEGMGFWECECSDEPVEVFTQIRERENLYGPEDIGVYCSECGRTLE